MTWTWCRSPSSARYAAIEANDRRRSSRPGRGPLCVGGDHSVTLPVIRALARRHGPLAVVHFDAHPDTWDEYFGSKFFHGTPFRRAVEEGADRSPRMIQVGIRGPLYGSEDFAFHDEHGIEVLRIEPSRSRGWRGRRRAWRACAACPLYLSFDIDAVDPAYAPATGHAGSRRPHLVRGADAGALAGRHRRWWALTSSRCRRRTTARDRSPRCSPPTWLFEIVSVMALER